MSAISWPTLVAALASIVGGAALVEFGRLPRRIGAHRRSGLNRPRRGVIKGQPAIVGIASPRARWAATAGLDVRVERLLDAAGRTSVPDASALAARRRMSAIVGAAWGGAVAWIVLPPALALAACVAGGVGGRVLPDAALRRAGTHRIVQLRSECPELLDLLAVAFGCGLPLRLALDAAGQWSVGELSTAMRRAAGELARGAGTDPTLDRLVREHPILELEAAVAIVERSRVHGTPASAPLRALAVDARHARARRAAEHAARAAPRVQLVAALLLVPAALCVLAASIVAGGFHS